MAAELTVKLTSKDRETIFIAVTVTVAVYVPALRPVFGLTVKVSVLSVSVILLIVVFDRVKPVALAPESVTFKSPVASLPVLVTVISLGGCSPSPSGASSKV